MSEQNFIALCVAGAATADQIDSFVARWHRNEAGQDQELHEFLGMSDKEYADWIKDAHTIPGIIAARKLAAV